MFEYPVVFVDIETTGGSYRNSRVLEVAAIRYENGQVTREFSTLINPETYIPAAITRLTSIKEADIVDAPTFADIAEELFEVMEGAIFVAHNVRFDYSFLKNEFALVGFHFSPKLLCTVRLSRALYRLEKGHSLAKLIERHEIPVFDRHRALADAQAILYFSKLAFEEHGADVFNQAIALQLKSQSLPPNLDMQELQQIENAIGVYIFKDERGDPIYIGKSINLRKRILSHFQNGSSKELKISQATHHIETIPASSELAALLLESKLIKEKMPLYNRRLRRVREYAMLIKKIDNGYATVKIQSGALNNQIDLGTVYGLYESRTKAKKRIEELTRSFLLCPKLMGLEKSSGACFSYSLGKCKGACIGEESAVLYNRRFELALENNRIALWPYDTPIVIPVNQTGEGVVIDNWMIQRYLDSEGAVVLDDTEPNFDVDEYKIIKRFIRDNKNLVRRYKN